MVDKSIEVEQRLIAPKGTVFAWNLGGEIGHLVSDEKHSFMSLCGKELESIQLRMYTSKESEICTECLNAWKVNKK